MPKPEEFRRSSDIERTIGLEMEYTVPPALCDSTKLHSLIETTGLSVVKEGFTSNGSKLYIDVGHLEYATPESMGPFEAALTDHAGMRVVSNIHEAASRQSEKPLSLPLRLSGAHVFSDQGAEKGIVTKGYHENYCIPAPTPDEALALQGALVAHLATRQVWNGNGFVSNTYQMSQKASGIGEGLVMGYGRRTAHKHKPMVGILTSSGDKAPDGWKIAEVRFADPSMFPFITFLSLATTSLTLRLIEQGFITGKNADRFGLKNPVHAMSTLSSDISQFNKRRHELSSGTEHLSALEIQTRLAESALYMANTMPLPADEEFAAHEWYKLCKLMSDPDIADDNYAGLVGRVEWASKYHLMKRRIRGRINVHNFDAVRFDLRWAALDKHSFGNQVASRTSPMASDFNDHIDHYVSNPPARTRAKPRAHMINTRRVSSSDWIMGHLSKTKLSNKGVYYLDPNHDVA